MNLTLYTKALKELFTAGKGDCKQFFASNNCVLELAYYNLYNQNPEEAKRLFQTLIEEDIRAHWGMFFTTLCTGKLAGYPSYFELRNFFEIDFNILFTYYLGQYIEEICKSSDWLSVTNPEIYKYIGRVFLKNGYEEYGLYFLEKAKENFYKDPELHYLFAEYFNSTDQKDKALKFAKSCLEILPRYYPAEKLLKELQF